MNRLNDLALSARDVPAYMQAVGQAARAAARALAAATTQSKNAALASAATNLEKNCAAILVANAKDVTPESLH